MRMRLGVDGIMTRPLVTRAGTALLVWLLFVPTMTRVDRVFRLKLDAQTTYESTVAELASNDAGTRLKAVRLLKGAAYLESAVPLARLVLDSYDEIQLEA